MKAGKRLTSLTSVKFKLEKALASGRTRLSGAVDQLIQRAVLAADAVFQRGHH
nr:hypothetical protein [Azospirillum sp. 412522]